MKAIEIKSRTNSNGQQIVDYQTGKPDRKVSVLILIEDEFEDEEKLWAKTISSNPAFDFLAEGSEEVYHINDGDCFTLRPQKKASDEFGIDQRLIRRLFCSKYQ